MRRRIQSACLALLILGFVCAAPAFAQTSSPAAASSAPAAVTSSKQSPAASVPSSQTQTQAQPQSQSQAQSQADPQTQGRALAVLPGSELPRLKPPVAAPPPPPVRVPVMVPAGTRIAVVLDTPVSTRISHTGQLINFRTSEPLYLEGRLVLPSDSMLDGKVTEVHKPGLFSTSGNIRMAVDALQQPDGSSTPLAAKLEAADPQASGKGKSDKSKAATILSAVILASEGALIGSQVGGGKGAVIGAGAGTAIALSGVMIKHGQDVYLEPGTPFLVTLNQPVQMWAIVPQNSGSAANSPAAGFTPGAAPSGAASPASGTTDPRTDSDRPKLEHRPKPLPPQLPPI